MEHISGNVGKLIPNYWQFNWPMGSILMDLVCCAVLQFFNFPLSRKQVFPITGFEVVTNGCCGFPSCEMPALDVWLGLFCPTPAKPILWAGLGCHCSALTPVMLVTEALCKWYLQGGLTPRLRLHEEKVIKDRRHHLKTYPNCFVAKELIDWLIDHKEASDRETAIKLVQKLLDHSIIHHGKCSISC